MGVVFLTPSLSLSTRLLSSLLYQKEKQGGKII